MHIFDRLHFFVSFFLVLITCTANAEDTECKRYIDSKGTKVSLHPKAFVDEIICPGELNCRSEPYKIRKLANLPEDILGPPDYLRKKGRGIYSLGCKGKISGKFTDNLIVDVPGPDLFIFEVGRAKEKVTIEISQDGKEWLDVGNVAGSKSSIDIKDRVKPGQVFQYIRLTDLGTSCYNPTAGADIDAIATYAYSWAYVQDESSTVFYDFAKCELNTRGKRYLDRLFSEYKNLKNYRLEITGHTDSIGTRENNLALSVCRANSVAQHVISSQYFTAKNVQVYGLGESKPVKPNRTNAGRAKNRRVALTFIPLSPCKQ